MVARILAFGFIAVFVPIASIVVKP